MYTAIVIPLGRFQANGDPAPHVQKRLAAALTLVKTYRIRWAILSGGPTLDNGLKSFNERCIGETGKPTSETEASLAQRYWSEHCAIPSWLLILKDTISMETVGNVVFPVEAFIRPLEIYRILCVTSGFHVSRCQKLYDSICRDVHATVFPTEYEEEAAYDHVPRGEHFVEGLCDHVTATVPARHVPSDHRNARSAAFQFVTSKHDRRDRLYQHVNLNECVKALEWPESALSIRQTQEIPEIRNWLDKRWLLPTARSLRQEVADNYRMTTKVPPPLEAQTNMVQTLAELGKLIFDEKVSTFAMKEMINTIAARQWFTFHLGKLLPKNPTEQWRCVAMTVLLSIEFCQEHHDDLIVYSSKNRDDEVIGADRLEIAAKQCRTLLL